MLLKLKNIGMLSEASVDLAELTIIAGENDTGKSTVGKTIFAIVKALSRAEVDLDENKYEKIQRVIMSLYRHISLESRRDVEFPLDRRELYIRIKSLVSSERYNEACKLVDDIFGHSLKGVELRLVDNLKNIIVESSSREDIVRRALQKALNSTFQDEICKKNAHDESSIEIIENNKVIFAATILHNKVVRILISDNIYFNDSTYIETPFVLDLSEQIRGSVTLFDIDNSNRINILGRGRTSLRYKDFIDKLSFEDNNEIDLFRSQQSKITSVEKVLNGKFIYNRQTREFLFSRDETSYKSTNVASGLKCFGILQMLYRNDFLRSGSLLILDEPEVHLHPKWQLLFAEGIIDLISNGVNILVNSHSPYMIEALKRYAEKYNVKANYYLADKDSIVISDSSLELIFKKLAEPYVTFDKMDSDSIRKKSSKSPGKAKKGDQ